MAKKKDVVEPVEAPAIFSQAHLGFLLHRPHWPAHEHITGNGEGNLVDWQGNPVVPPSDDLAATDWSVRK